MGSLQGTVESCSTLSIHGNIYYDVRLRVADRILGLRIADHLCPRPPAPPVRLQVELLMGQVIGVGLDASPGAGTQR